jgi:hypothetical protein
MRSLLLCALLLGCGQTRAVIPDADPVAPDAAAPADAATCAASPAGLRARWRAEMDTGDDTGANDGVAVGAGYTEGRHGDAFLFDGVDDLVTADSDDELYSTASFSVEAWVETFSTGVVIIDKIDCAGAGACPGDYWGLEIGNDAIPYFAVRVDARPAVFARGDSISDGDWHHLVGVRDVGAGEVRLYVDGELAETTEIAGADLGALVDTDGASDPVTIGAGRTVGSETLAAFLLGAIDEVAYYETAIGDAEVAAIYAAPDGICHD